MSTDAEGLAPEQGGEAEARFLRGNGAMAQPTADHPGPGGRSPGVTYRAAHRLIVKVRGPAGAGQCEWLGCDRRAQEWAFNHACPPLVDERGREYSPDPDCYLRLCRAHHRREDAEVRRYRRGKERAALATRPWSTLTTPVPDVVRAP